MSEDKPVEFSELLRGYAAAQERAAASTAPEPAVEVLQLAARVRRRRMVRTGTVAAAGVAAALVGAFAVYDISRPDPLVPAPQPTETETFEPSPSPTPSDEPSAEPTQVPEEPEDVTRHALLPDVAPMTGDLWAETDGDWLLGRYTASADEADGSSMRSPSVLYLVAPDGATYEVPVPNQLRASVSSLTDWSLVDWRPGDSRAVFIEPEVFEDDREGERTNQVVIDLATGEELVAYGIADTVILLPDDRTLVIRLTDAGLTVAQVHDRDGYHVHEIGPFGAPPYISGWPQSRGWAVDPSRTQLLLETPQGTSVFDLSDVKQLTIPQLPAPAMSPCSPIGWLEQDRLVLRCAEMQDLGDGYEGLGSYLWIANLGDGSTRRLTTPQTPDGHQVTEVWQVGPDVVVDRVTEYPGCGQGLAVVPRDESQKVVAGAEEVRVVGVRQGRLVVETFACDTGSYQALVSLDVATGQVSMVLPQVEGATVYFDFGAGLSQMSGPYGGWW